MNICLRKAFHVSLQTFFVISSQKSILQITEPIWFTALRQLWNRESSCPDSPSQRLGVLVLLAAKIIKIERLFWNIQLRPAFRNFCLILWQSPIVSSSFLNKFLYELLCHLNACLEKASEQWGVSIKHWVTTDIPWVPCPTPTNQDCNQIQLCT